MVFGKRTVLVVALVSMGIYVIEKYCNGPMYLGNATIKDKVVIITGANTGIGKETALDLVKRGGRVYMACRSLSRAQEAINDIINKTGVSPDRLPIMHLDLSSLESVRDFAREFKKKERRLDILINNAGVMFVPLSRTKEGFELTFGVNHLGHFLLTQLLADELLEASPSRVVTVSSIGHMFASSMRFEDLNYNRENEYNRFYSYFESKLANVLFTTELAKRLEGKVTAYALHPGSVRTELTRYLPLIDRPPFSHLFYYLTWPFMKDATSGAQTSIYCAVDPRLQHESGKYYSDVAEKLPSAAALRPVDARRLWYASMDLVGLDDADVHPKLQRTPESD